MTPDFPTWGSDNPSVATVTTQQVHGVAAGSTDAWASGWISEGNASYCTVVHEQPTASVSVSAVPVNFKLTSATDGGEGVLGIIRNFSWQSSDGNLNDLSNCSMREYVTYPTSNNSTCPGNSPPQQCYYPSSPPWAASGSQYTYPNPTTGPAQQATGGTSQDTNAVYNLNFVKPYTANSFSATQYVQYSCFKGQWTDLYGPVTLTRSVAESGGKWSATVSASDTSVTSTYALP